MTVSPSADLLTALNPAQQHAVTVPGGPLLILAGPGSGKTRVIAHRIAYLVRECAAPPWRLLAVTFTNKAAAEMRDRVQTLLGESARDLTMGTFHAICARILRRDGEVIGLPAGFAIFDTDDQLSIIKQIEGNEHIDSKRFAPRAVLSAISAAKNERVTPQAYIARADSYFKEIVGRVYGRYEDALARNTAADFDDLLGRTLELFEQHPAVRLHYAERYLHVLIDEFQDTNLVQYTIAQALASEHRNITAVGDPDQSIYSWRAADIRNIQYFERDFTGTEVVLLEQNYRSTGHILRAAHALIARADGRHQRALWTENPDGAPVVVHELYDGDDEGAYIASEVRRLMSEGLYRPADIAVMYRTNAQSRSVEEAFIERGVPYRIVGGTRFYDRREVRDLLAYLRLVQNESDSVAFTRIVNVPARGIGDRTLEELQRIATELGVSPLAAAARIARGDEVAAMPRLRSDIRAALGIFVDAIDSLSARRETLGVAALLDEVLVVTQYREHLTRSDEEHADARWENVQELRAVATQYEDVEPAASLTSFLEDIALVSDIDDPDADVPDAVTLTTLHAAKGLEYPVVFMPGMEEGLLPHFRSLDDPAQMEEERRVCYVGMTRARERLYLLHALRRFVMGGFRPQVASRFLADLPRADITSPSGARVTGSTLSPRERRAAIASRQFDTDTAAVPQFEPGQRVRHDAFGTGTVVACVSVGGDQQVTVAFEGQGVKRLLASVAPLVVLVPNDADEPGEPERVREVD